MTNSIPASGFGQTRKKLPNDSVIFVYICLVIFCRSLVLIAPIKTLLSASPLRHITAYLGIIGAVLLVIDLLTQRMLLKSRFCWLLFGMLFCSFVASIKTVNLGLKDNAYDLCWGAIEFALFYSFAYRQNARIKSLFTVLFFSTGSVWCLSCVVSILQFVYHIGYTYVIDSSAQNLEAARQGFTDGRLFGIFDPMNSAVFVTICLLILGVYVFSIAKRKGLKVLLIIMESLFMIELILSGSRAAIVGLASACFCYTLLRILTRKTIGRSTKTVIVSVLIACLSAVALVAIFLGLKTCFAYVPSLFQSTKTDKMCLVITPGCSPVSITEDSNLTFDDMEDITSEDIFNRDELSGDSSNGRFEIWSNYLSCYADIGLFGLSPGNYREYMIQHHSDLYIVEGIASYHPDRYSGGIIYSTHNGYLMTFVCSGAVGFIFMIIFLGCCCLCVIKHPPAEVTKEYMFSLAAVVSLLAMIMFDVGVFFSEQSMTFMFWVFAGIVSASFSIPSGNRNALICRLLTLR